jgi:hypothetical protein
MYFLQFQSVCILSSIILFGFSEIAYNYAYLLFVIAILSHTAEVYFEQKNIFDARRENSVVSLFENFKLSEKRKKEFSKDWKREEENDKDQ